MVTGCAYLCTRTIYTCIRVRSEIKLARFFTPFLSTTNASFFYFWVFSVVCDFTQVVEHFCLVGFKVFQHENLVWTQPSATSSLNFDKTQVFHIAFWKTLLRLFSKKVGVLCFTIQRFKVFGIHFGATSEINGLIIFTVGWVFVQQCVSIGLTFVKKTYKNLPATKSRNYISFSVFSWKILTFSIKHFKDEKIFYKNILLVLHKYYHSC